MPGVWQSDFRGNLLRNNFLAAALSAALLVLPLSAQAGEGGWWWSGDWDVKLGATAFTAPRYRGDNSYLFQVKPLISVGRAGNAVRFSSRDDNPSFALYDEGMVRAGLTGKLVMPRDAGDSADLKGLKAVKFGLEAGVFAEVYPSDWLRLRGEVRHGIRSHQGIVADLAADVFADITPNVRISAGPRLTLASADYMNTYYGVDATASRKSGLTAYSPEGGLESAGVGAQIDWKVTDRMEAGAFADYRRLMGPAGDSSLVQERGTRNQFIFGVSTSYRFGVAIP
jgi:outer membrane scaffolding protein for murein synthesis (MipA/OmpV family)